MGQKTEWLLAYTTLELFSGQKQLNWNVEIKFGSLYILYYSVQLKFYLGLKLLYKRPLTWNIAHLTKN